MTLLTAIGAVAFFAIAAAVLAHELAQPNGLLGPDVIPETEQ